MSRRIEKKFGVRSLEECYEKYFREKNALTRNLWVERVLSQIPDGARLLDAGAGECQYQKHCAHLEYVSQDFSQYDGSGNSKGLQQNEWDVSQIDIISDIVEIPVEDEAFDVILCTEVLEHLPRPHLAIREFLRILKPGGKLILTAPFCSFTHFAPYHYVSGFNSYYYKEVLNEYGFTILELQNNGNYFDFFAQEIRRLPEMMKRYSDVKINKVHIFLLKNLLKVLSYCSKRDNGSEEIMTFGFHVLAQKT